MKSSHATWGCVWSQVLGEPTDWLAGVCASFHAVLCLRATIFLLSHRGQSYTLIAFICVSTEEWSYRIKLLVIKYNIYSPKECLQGEQIIEEGMRTCAAHGGSVLQALPWTLSGCLICVAARSCGRSGPRSVVGCSVCQAGEKKPSSFSACCSLLGILWTELF